MSQASRLASLIRTAFGKDDPRYFTSAIIVAAGNASRMGGDVPKQFMELCGAPVIVRTLLAYEQSRSIHEIIVVCRDGDEEKYTEFKEKYSLSKLSKIVIGDNTRQLSVIKGLEAVSDKADFVAVADGARCLTTPEMINEVARQAYRYDAAIAATRASDTVKRVSKGFITETVPRDEVWLAQTPQIFKINLYRAAAYNALEVGRQATDDSSLVEAIGRSVFAVECGKENIKLTTPDDIIHAEAILKSRTSKEER